jgi:hypothetical protein
MLRLWQLMNLRRVRGMVEALAPISWREVPCLFILSTGRTGTLALCRLLNLSPEVLALHEPHPRPYEAFRSAYAEVWDRPEPYRRIFEEARRGHLAWAALRGKAYAEGTAVKYFAPAIAQLIPRSRFLHVYRHPADVVRSCMRRGWFANHPLDRYRPCPSPGGPDYNKWLNWNAFARNCWIWGADNEFFLRVRDAVSEDRFLSVAFEEFIAPESKAYERIFGFLGVACPPHKNVREVLGVRHNEQTTGSFPRPAEWSEGLRKTMRTIAGGTMEALGYV